MENRILDYMNRYGYITTRQAFEDLGCTRLSEYIRRLRLQYEIDDEIETGINRYGEKVHWKKYFIRGNKNEKYN
jgi:hypothetical protein